jgi:hypothetical protein
MTDYQPTDADREAAKAIKQEISLVNHTVEQIAAIIAEKMRPERELALKMLADANESRGAAIITIMDLRKAADRLADAVENLDVPHAESCSVDRNGAQCTCGLRALDDSERAYREATK